MIVHPNKFRRMNPALLLQILGGKAGPPGPPGPPIGNLVGWWLTSGGNWTDYSGNGNTLINDGYSASTFPTNNSPCILWDGSSRNSSAAGVVAKLQFSGLGTPFTLTSWVAAITTPGAMIDTQDPTNGYGGYGFFAYTPTAGEVYFNLLGSNNTYAVDVTSNTGGTINPAEPHFFALTYNGNQLSSGLTVYVDGVPVPMTPGGAGLQGVDCTSNAPFTVGSLPGEEFNYGLQGQQTDVRVYDVVATAAQIAALYAAGPAFPPA